MMFQSCGFPEPNSGHFLGPTVSALEPFTLSKNLAVTYLAHSVFVLGTTTYIVGRKPGPFPHGKQIKHAIKNGGKHREGSSTITRITTDV